MKILKSFNKKVLFVDDDESILDGLRRQFYKIFDITTALSGIEGLQRLEREGPFAVVVSDMHMARMDGIQFLETVKERYPKITRVMLTGQADLAVAINAVNKGSVFRFVTKPCDKSTMMQVLEAGVTQYYLQKVEQELLENTLKGSINVLLDILSLTNPQAFSKSTRLKSLTHKVVQYLKLSDIWQYEIAAMLSQVGYIAFPANIINKLYLNKDLSNSEEQMLKNCSLTSADLIKHIPRLENISQMIAKQNETSAEHDEREKDITQNPIVMGAEILKAVTDFDTLVSQNFSREEAVDTLKKKVGVYNLKILSALEKIEVSFTKVIRSKAEPVSIAALNADMILGENVRSKDGNLLATKGQEVTKTMCMLFANYAKQGYIQDTVLVCVP